MIVSKIKRLLCESFLPTHQKELEELERQYCNKCMYELTCSLWENAFCGLQPRKWIYENKKPTCTSFENRES